MLKRNEKMLELLQMRGITYNNAFIDALQMSGHNMIADALRDELLIGSKGKVTWSDIGQKLSSLDKTITKQQKEKIMDVINNKISENVAKEIWRKNDVDKEKIVETKQLQLEDNWKFTDKIKEKDSEIIDLKGGLQKASEVAIVNNSNVEDINEVLEQLKKAHKEDMNTQIKYNSANEKSLQRLTERYNETHEILTNLTDTLRDRVQYHRELVGQTRDTPQPPNEDEDAVKSGMKGRGQRTLADTLALIESLHNSGQLQESHTEERRAIAQILMTDSDSNLAENLKIYTDNMKSKVETIEQTLKTLTSEILIARRSKNSEEQLTENTITELKQTISQQSIRVEELQCVIAGLEARIAAMTAEVNIAAGRRAPRSKEPPRNKPFNAGGLAIQRSSPTPLHVSTSARRVCISPSRIDVVKRKTPAPSYVEKGRVAGVTGAATFPVIGVAANGSPNRTTGMLIGQVGKKNSVSQHRWKSQMGHK